jgi:hypothetical protein
MRILLIGVAFLLSCTRREEGHTIISSGHSFTLQKDTFLVDSFSRIPPISVHDEISPKYRIYLNDSTEMYSPHPISKGSKIIFEVYVKNP